MSRTEVRRDGKVKETFASGDETRDQNDAWDYILHSQPQSVDWAMRYEGWEIVTVPDDGKAEDDE